ncbi:MAG TPA: hypothetical protein VJ723_12000 [Candidatus Angelobacter sp.]|nr:hypothetical protein [Candidatus Angelobacter sp.]
MGRDNFTKPTLEILQKGEVEANRVISSELNLAFEELKLLVEQGQTAAALKGIGKLQEAINLLLADASYSDTIRHRLQREALGSGSRTGTPVFQA